MEPTQGALRKHLRIVLKLGKFQVIERSDTALKIRLGDIYTMTIFDPIVAKLDVRPGDILSYYTEAPLADNPNSNVHSGN